MTPTRVSGFLCSFVIVSLFFLGGCALTGLPRPVYSPETAAFVNAIESHNQSVITVNGLGGLTLSDAGKAARYRLAWAAAFPDRLRLILLISGQAVETVVHDGRTLTVTSHTRAHDPIIKRTSNPNLERLTTLPLTTEQIIVYLTGRVPVQPHDRAELMSRNGQGYRLTLFKGRDTLVQTVDFDTDKQVRGYTIHAKKQTRYQITLAARKIGHSPEPALPEQIRIDQATRSLLIRVDQTRANPALTDEAFKVVHD